MKVTGGVDQTGCSAGRSRGRKVLDVAGKGIALGVLQVGTIIGERLLGAGPNTIVVAFAMACVFLALVLVLARKLGRRARSAAAYELEDSSRRRQEAKELGEAILAARRAETEADEANRAKTDFLACMSHEIRTPLNSVIGFAALLLQQPDLAPRARLFGERIQAGGAALLTVVDDILDFSQVEAGAVELDRVPFSLHGLIDECVSLVQHAALAKGLSLHVSLVDHLPAGVMGDAARLRQILLNLLNNAIKFTEEGSVTLDIRRDRASADRTRVIISVIDTGIGITRDDQARLFQRFAQVDASIRRTYGGTGLGLVICRRLVELMGGSIGVDSLRGIGSTFFFTVPLPAAALPSGDAAAPVAVAGIPRTILLVEDVAINQDLVCEILGSRGHTVDVVGNGAEAVMAVQDMDYDLVLMDVQMPYLDGLEATCIIRALTHPCRDVPIVAMTANVLPEQTAAARAAGMIDVIQKPFSPSQVLAVLNRVAGRGGLPAPPKTPRAEPTGHEHDAAILGRLATLLGDAKLRSLLQGLVASLTDRFAADPETKEGRAELRRQAHASVAGSGMLGFTAFSIRCKAFQTAPEEGFTLRLATLKADAANVVSIATRLAEQSDSLVTSSAA